MISFVMKVGRILASSFSLFFLVDPTAASWIIGPHWCSFVTSRSSSVRQCPAAALSAYQQQVARRSKGLPDENDHRSRTLLSVSSSPHYQGSGLSTRIPSSSRIGGGGQRRHQQRTRCWMEEKISRSSEGDFNNTYTTPATTRRTLLSLLSPSNTCDVDRMSGTDLAYVGDCVYELFVRSRTVWPPKRTADLQQQAVALVRAEHQSKLLSKLRAEFDLTHKEQQVLNRGRNAGSGRNNNRRDPAAYQDSTAFEAVLGYMYIATPDRCGELLQWIDSIVDEL